MLIASGLHGWLESFGMTAAWVQAWGSLLALSIAIWLAYYNQNQQQKRERKKQAQYMEAISFINKEAIQAVSYIIGEMNSNALHHHGITTSNLERCIQALGSITLESLPNSKAYMAIHQLRRELQGIHQVAINQQGYDLTQGISPVALEDVDDGMKRLKNADSDFDQALIALK